MYTVIIKEVKQYLVHITSVELHRYVFKLSTSKTQCFRHSIIIRSENVNVEKPCINEADLPFSEVL